MDAGSRRAPVQGKFLMSPARDPIVEAPDPNSVSPIEIPAGASPHEWACDSAINRECNGLEQARCRLTYDDAKRDLAPDRVEHELYAATASERVHIVAKFL